MLLMAYGLWLVVCGLWLVAGERGNGKNCLLFVLCRCSGIKTSGAIHMDAQTLCVKDGACYGENGVMVEIFYIGGSPCSGKSTIAEMLVQKYGFQYYKQDDHLHEYIDKGAREGHELFQKVSHMSTEEMWMRDPFEQYHEERALYEMMLGYSLSDISALSHGQDKAIIAEGAGFMPGLAEKMGTRKTNYICITPTKEFQINAYSQRAWISHYLSDCADKDKAFRNWMERDAIFAQAVMREAVTLGYESLVVNGEKSIEENFVIVEKTFALSCSC